MLVGKKVVLEEIDPSNIEQMRLWRNDPKLRRYFREYKDITKDKQVEWYKEKGNNTNPAHVYFQIMSLGKETSGHQIYTQQERVDNRYLVGCCGGLYLNNLLKSIEFSIFVAPEFQGQGLAKDAMLLLLKYLFEDMNIHKVWGEVYEFNDAIGFYRKLGFKDEGMLRDNCFKEGKYYNSFMISMLENEWKEKYK